MKSIISIWILILIGVISIVIPKTIMSLLTEQSTSRGMQRHKMFDRRVYFDRTLLTTHIVVTRAIGMRWGNNENETSKNQMQMLPCKIHIRVKPDKYINTLYVIWRFVTSNKFSSIDTTWVAWIRWIRHL